MVRYIALTNTSVHDHTSGYRPTWVSGELMHEVLCGVQADSGLREELDELLPQTTAELTQL